MNTEMNDSERWLWAKLWEKEPEFAAKLMLIWATAEATWEEGLCTTSPKKSLKS